MGSNYHVPLPGKDAVRKWMAPHDGRVRIEGAPAIQGTSTEGLVSSVLKNAEELWSARLVSPDTQASSHDTTVAVRKGDAISFSVRTLEPAKKAAAPRNNKHGAPLKIGVKELTCAGPMYRCSAVSKLVVRLPGPGKTFSAIVGVDADGAPGVKGSAVFSVIVGGKTAFKSGELKPSKEGARVNVDLAGAKEFVLEVGDAGGAIAFDWASWAEAKAMLADGKGIWLSDLHLNEGSRGQPRVLWDPVITYVDSIATSKQPTLASGFPLSV